LSYERWCPDSLRHVASRLCRAGYAQASTAVKALLTASQAADGNDRRTGRFLHCAAESSSLSVIKMWRKYANEARPSARCAMHLLTNRRFRFISADWCALLRQVSRWYVRPEGGDSG